VSQVITQRSSQTLSYQDFLGRHCHVISVGIRPEDGGFHPWTFTFWTFSSETFSRMFLQTQAATRHIEYIGLHK